MYKLWYKIIYIYHPCSNRKCFFEAGPIYRHVHKQFNKIRNDVHNVGSSALPKNLAEPLCNIFCLPKEMTALQKTNKAPRLLSFLWDSLGLGLCLHQTWSIHSNKQVRVLTQIYAASYAFGLHGTVCKQEFSHTPKLLSLNFAGICGFYLMNMSSMIYHFFNRNLFAYCRNRCMSWARKSIISFSTSPIWI